MRKSKADTTVTIQKLIDVARNHFTSYGYANTALEAIVQEAGVTRGALYHHFRNKQELFQIVLEEVQREIAERVEQEASTSDEIWLQLYLGCRAFVMAAVEDRNRHIMLIDGPAILGWGVWRELDRAYSMRLLREQLEMMQHHGCFRDASLDALVHFISGGLNEIALWLADASSQQNALDEAMGALHVLLDGWKCKSGSQ